MLLQEILASLHYQKRNGAAMNQIVLALIVII